MDELINRFSENLLGRVGGLMTFRLILQPAMAIFFSIRDGLKDAREKRPPFGLLTDPAHRRYVLKDGWKSVSRVFIIAIVMDAVYQVIVLRWFYPGEALIVAAVLALLPYTLVRGPVNWISRRRVPPEEKDR